MPRGKKPKASESAANAPSAPLKAGSGNSSAAKRKRADADDTATDGSENDQTQKQSRQDDSPDRSASSTHTANSHEILFGIPWLSFQSPFEGDMCLEVATPSTKYENGCIRLHGPRGHWNMDAMFSLPFASIESIIIMRNLKRSAGKKKAYEVLIVPATATGVAPVSRKHAQVIAFNLPDRKVDAQDYGSMTSGVDKNTLVLSLFKDALNERLAEFNKTVTDLSQEDETSNPIFRIETTLEPVMDTNLEKKTKGLLQFLDGELLFRAKAVTLCIPIQQLNEIHLILATETKNRIVGTKLVLSVPSSLETTALSDQPASRRYALLAFHDLPVTLAKSIYHFADNRNIKINLCQQHFYDYAKNQPMSGWGELPPSLKEKLFAKID
ncbi:hypothetical protein F5Y07DRAFT_81428 [Xylaria sp. FL0933]|nr:hypothetical protein F5Y07DRAFT_81428 [Xylaria sp. FL0933]